MIDFNNASFLKLRSVPASNFANMVSPLLTDGESILYAFQSIRDGVVFTQKRVIAINVQGVTGKKRDLTSLPYCKVQTFSFETAGVMDLDAELDLWFSGAGNVRFEFTGGVDVAVLCRLISDGVL